MYHNHEENIKLARNYIALFVIGGIDRLDTHARNKLVTLLSSMVEDAETGHLHIEQLTKKLEENLMKASYKTFNPNSKTVTKKLERAVKKIDKNKSTKKKGK